MSPRHPSQETRYQRIQRLIREGKCGLLPFDLSCPCPRRGGPERPDPDHPGRVGFLTCNGCQYNTDLYFDSRVCTHPNARQVAARWLADAIQRWENRQAAAAVPKPEPEPAPAPEPVASDSPPAPPPQPTQLSLF